MCLKNSFYLRVKNLINILLCSVFFCPKVYLIVYNFIQVNVYLSLNTNNLKTFKKIIKFNKATAWCIPTIKASEFFDKCKVLIGV